MGKPPPANHDIERMIVDHCDQAIAPPMPKKRAAEILGNVLSELQGRYEALTEEIAEEDEE